VSRFRVRAKYVTCRSAEAAQMLPAPWNKQPLAISGYNCGQILPPSVPAEELDRLLAGGLIEPVEELQ
jgi:hypothetical protein